MSNKAKLSQTKIYHTETKIRVSLCWSWLNDAHTESQCGRSQVVTEMRAGKKTWDLGMMHIKACWLLVWSQFGVTYTWIVVKAVFWIFPIAWVLGYLAGIWTWSCETKFRIQISTIWYNVKAKCFSRWQWICKMWFVWKHTIFRKT